RGKARDQAVRSATRYFGNLARNRSRQKSPAHRFEVRRARFTRSARRRVETDRKQKGRFENYPLSRGTDLGIGHFAGERIGRGRSRFQREGRGHGGLGYETRRRADQTV